MIFWFINWLDAFGLPVPSGFGFTSTRMMLAAMTSLIFCIFVGPFFIRKLYELRIGQTIRKEECPHLGELHQKKQDTPTMGGILIIAGILLSLFFWMDLSTIQTYLLLFTTLSLALVGGTDDYLKLKYKNAKGLSARKKLFFQALIASVVALYFLVPTIQQQVLETTGIAAPIVKVESSDASISYIPISLQEFAGRIYVPFFRNPLVALSGGGLIFAFLFILFVIVGSSNAVNLTDGLDGLAAGCLITVASALAIVAFVSNNSDIARYLHTPYIEGSGEVAVFLAAFVGATLGFLWYNGYPAQIFMGDVGSLSLGGVIGVSAILLGRAVFLGIIGGVFVMEALSVIIQVVSYRYRNKKRVFLCAPLHHHFEYRGWTESKVVVRFWIVALLLAIIGIVSLKFQ